MKRVLPTVQFSVDKNAAVLKNKIQFAFIKFLKFFIAIYFILAAQISFGQTTYDWLSSAPDGNWKQGASGAARWNPGGLWDNPSSGTGAILRFNNNTFTTMTNNVSGTYIIHKIIFGSSATSSRTIGGNAVQFFEFGSTWPRIQNDATNTTHTINFPITASSNSGFNMELASYSGALIFGGTVNNNGRVVQIYGDNTVRDATNRYVRLGGIVSGSGALNVSQFGVVKLNAAHTYTGQTQIDNGELWIESSGSNSSTSGTFVGNGGQLANVAKLWLSNSSGGTTYTNNLTINNGNANTRIVGGLNTSGTHIFSGNITNNSGNFTLSAYNVGGTTEFQGIISGSNPIKIDGDGILKLTNTSNSYTGGTTLTSGTLSIASNAVLSSGSLTMGNGSTPCILAITDNTTRSQGISIVDATTASVIDVANTKTFTFSGGLTNTGSTNTTKYGKSGAGTFIVSGSSTYAGQVQIGEGTVIVQASSGLGANTSTTARGIDLGLNVGDVSMGNNVVLQATNGVTVPQSIYVAPNTSSATRTVSLSGSGAAVFNNEIYLDGDLTVSGGTGTVTLSGKIINNKGLIISGGTVILSNNTNTYTGATAINSGTLSLTGTIASGSAVTVASGATLSGTGSAAGTVAVTGTISPNGSGTYGTLSTGAMTWNNGGQYICDISKIPSAGSPGTDWDRLTIGGTLTTPGSGAFTVALNGTIASFSNATPYTWVIGTYTGSAPSASFVSVNSTGLTNALNGGSFSINFSGNNINLVFTPLTWTITSSAGANGSISPNGATVVNNGASQAYTITPSTGYHIADVLVNGSSVGAVSSYTISNVRGDSSISASFVINTYTVTSSAGANGSISPNGATTKNYGTSQAYTIIPNTGYHVDDVLVNGVSVGAVTSYTISNIRGDSSISASFAINTYTVTSSAGANGSISPNGATTKNYGTSQAYTITPNTGYHVDDVLVNGVSVGAVTSYTISNIRGDSSISASFAIDACVGYTWTGAEDNNFANPDNWQCGVVPPASAAVSINNGSGNVVIDADLDITGSLDFNNTTDTLIIAPGVTLKATGGDIDFHGNAVLIKSDATGTGSIGKITGTLSNATNVTSERYIRQNTYRGWRLLAVPVTTAGQTIRQSWQEGATSYTSNPKPGYGTRITSNVVNAESLGYDAETFNNSLLQRVGTSWQGYQGDLTTTKVSRGTVGDAWMLYVRGDRGVDTAGVITAPTQTILRVKGPLYTTYPVVSIPSGTYGVVGNILPSEIDFTQLNRGGGADDAFLLWDPQLYGSYGLGGFQTFSSSTPIPWKPVPGGGSYGTTPNTKIQSGMGFIVRATGSAGTIQLTEASKTDGPNVDGTGFRPASPTAAIPYLETNLYAASGATYYLADGNIVGFDNSYSNDIDNKDNVKVPGFGDGIGMVRGAYVLSTEQRKLIVSGDVIQYRMTNLKKQAYKLEFVPSGLNDGITTAVLEDKYLNTTTPLNLGVTTTVVFNADPTITASFTDRFRIVFSVPTPVSIININAQQKNTAMQVDWKVAVENGVKQYEVEHSSDGINFSTAGTVSATGNNGGAVNYSFTDAAPVAGANYYRIKTVDLSGVVKYTTVVRVTYGSTVSSIVLSSTIISGNQISLQLNNQDKGRYGIRLINTAGQELLKSSFTHNGGNSTQSVSLPSLISKGVYQLEIVQPNGNKFTKKLVIN